MRGVVARPWAEARRKAQPGAAADPPWLPMPERVARQTLAEARQTLAEQAVAGQTRPAMPAQVAGQIQAVRQIPAEVVVARILVAQVAAGQTLALRQIQAQVVAGQTLAEQVVAGQTRAVRPSPVVAVVREAVTREAKALVRPAERAWPSLRAWVASPPWSTWRLHPQAPPPIASSFVHPHLRTG